jgi:predicted ATPase
LLAVIAHRIMGSVLFVRGDFLAGRNYLIKALELYNEPRDQAAVLTYGVDQKSIGLAHSAQILFALGYSDQALSAMEQAIAYAEQLKHSYNLGYTLFWSNVMGIQRRAAESVRERAQRLAALGREHGLPTWTAFGTFQYGAALAQLGDPHQGIVQMQQGLTSYLALGSNLFRPNKLVSLALALAETGQLQDAVGLLNEAVSMVGNTNERWFEAELHRCKGKLLLLHGTDETTEQAENCLLHALDIARRQQAKLWELRAASDLARLWRDQNRWQQAQQLLAPVYDWFSEGLDSSDLIQARALLDELDKKA